MKASRWRSDRASLFRVHGLISLSVCVFIGPPDVRRKRCMPVAVDCVANGKCGAESDDACATLRRFKNLDLEVRTHVYDSSGLELAARMHHRLVAAVAKVAQKKKFGGSTGVARTEKPRTIDASGVEDDRIAGGNEIHDIAEGRVLNPALRAVDDHQPALIAAGSRRLSDQLRWEIVVEVGGFTRGP